MLCQVYSCPSDYVVGDCRNLRNASQPTDVVVVGRPALTSNLPLSQSLAPKRRKLLLRRCEILVRPTSQRCIFRRLTKEDAAMTSRICDGLSATHGRSSVHFDLIARKLSVKHLLTRHVVVAMKALNLRGKRREELLWRPAVSPLLSQVPKRLCHNHRSNHGVGEVMEPARLVMTKHLDRRFIEQQCAVHLASTAILRRENPSG